MKYKNPTFKAMIAFGFFVVTLTTGCNKGGDGGGGGGPAPAPVAAPLVPAVVCTGCPPNPVNLLNNVQATLGGTGGYSMTGFSAASGTITMNFNVIGDSTRIAGNNAIAMPNDAPITRYNGPLAFQGTLTVNQLDPNLCNAPAGTYDLTTAEAGNWMAPTPSAFSTPVKFVATLRGTGTQLMFEVGQTANFFVASFGSLTTNATNVRLQGSILFSGINGTSCQKQIYVQ